MRLSELAAIVARAVEHARGEDPEVVVQTANGGCPTKHMEPVKSAHRGFDWTARFFVLHTATPVVLVNGLTKSVRELAEERLRELEDVSTKLGTRYIAKSHRESWIDGFAEGLWKHVTACGGDAPQRCAVCGRNLEETSEGDAGLCPGCTPGTDHEFHAGRRG